ncbi:MAG: tetratricopeptide repeat protein, partial [Chloroflexota bacterium]
ATYERCFSLGAQLQLPDFQVVSLGHLGKAYRHAGNLVLAAQSFDRAVVLCQEVGLAPQEAEALYERAVVAELQGQPQEALHAYREGLNLSEGERLYELAVRFLSQLGQLQQGLGEYTSAIEYYEACLKFLRETDNDRESETIILGQISHICVQIEDFERGLKAAEQGLENSRQTKQTAEEAAFLNDLSRIYLGKGNFEQARHYANQARLIAQQRRDHQALKDAEQLLSQLERGPDNVEEVPFSFRTMSGSIQTPEVHYQRGNLYYHEGALDRAIASYSRAINLNPKLTPAYINRGSVYTAKGYYDRALADYNRALELEPNDPVCFFNRGNVYRKRREYLRALSDYSEAIRLDPTDPDSYFNRGEVLRRMKLNLEAAADFQRVIKLSTGRDEAGVAQARRLLNELGKS